MKSSKTGLNAPGNHLRHRLRPTHWQEEHRKNEQFFIVSLQKTRGSWEICKGGNLRDNAGFANWLLNSYTLHSGAVKVIVQLKKKMLSPFTHSFFQLKLIGTSGVLNCLTFIVWTKTFEIFFKILSAERVNSFETTWGSVIDSRIFFVGRMISLRCFHLYVN